jgi:hypothetical protein
VGKDNISVNALAFAAIDIPGSMIWRYLDEQKVPPEALMQAFPVGRMGRPRGAGRGDVPVLGLRPVLHRHHPRPRRGFTAQ